ncbi:MAG: hypothetical protein FJ312_04950 [SAR202 cluster bacterium]|nr:hypothetical protein [SAR202 cluster bacterium]
MLDFSEIPLIDNHCHPFHRKQPDTEEEYIHYFSESRDPRVHKDHVRNGLFYRSNLRQMATLLGLPADAPAAKVMAERKRLGLKKLAVLAVTKSNTKGVIMDRGFPPEVAMSQNETEEMLKGTGCQMRRVQRLEMVYEDLITKSETFGEVEQGLIGELTDMRSKGIYGLKSVIAYRSGLNIQPTYRWEAMDGFQQIKKEHTATGKKIRVASKPVEDYLTRIALKMAAEQEIPVQFHTALGDTDEDMLESNPLKLRAVLEDPAFTNAPIVALHVWPYIQETAYLAHVYGNFYFDLSFALPLGGLTAPSMLEQAIGIAPYSKLLYGSDAPGLPDYFWLGGVVWRRGLEKLLGGWVEEGGITEAQARDIGRRILHENAEGLYRLKV